MPLLTFKDLQGGRVSPTQAIALVAGVADEIHARHARGDQMLFAADTDIALDHSGRVHFTRVSEGDKSADVVSGLASLLRRMLALDTPNRAASVPGGVMVLMARALGQIDLPPPTLGQFRDALARIVPDASGQRAALARSLVTTLPRETKPVRTQPAPAPGRVALQPAPTTPRVATLAASPATRNARMLHPAVAFLAGVAAAVGATLLVDPGRITQSRSVPHVSPLSRSLASAAAPAAAATTPRRLPTRIPDRRSAARLLLSDVGGGEPFSPSFSADGRELFFHTGRSTGRLMRADVNPDGTISRVTALLPHDRASDFHVVPSPAGDRLAFDSDRGGTRAVYVGDADGTDVRRISGPGFAAVPTWSPDGTQVAFVKADANPRTWNVWIADLSTGELRQVSHHRTGQAWGASWFPDGRRIVYSREEQLVIVDLGTGATIAYRSPLPGHLVRTPSVSPDGSRIVFQVQEDGVWLLDLTRSRMSRVLADHSAEEFHWSPDGRQIAYHARNGRRWGVWTFGASS